MTREEKQKAIDTLKISAPIMTLTQEEFNDYIQTLNTVMDWLKEEPCEDCIRREFIEIVVDYPPADLCTYPEYRGKPYFSIKYRENGKTHVGFGTYKIEMLSQWIKEYFISDIWPKTDMWSIKDVKDCFIKHGLITKQEPKMEVLDKIRTEIEQLTIIKGSDDYVRKMAELFSFKIKVLQIIDKYMAESEGV